ncbi:hypothetical protein PIB30_057494 [Stylosanthes scabra]|uniref:Uncharacterized protein n=1 Tax=Stylosanthes scabra TaxID=79078 RepID=A0ABU6XL93_9FABA|nr:hypothetical protein [Stylosanthes scabra]
MVKKARQCFKEEEPSPSWPVLGTAGGWTCKATPTLNWLHGGRQCSVLVVGVELFHGQDSSAVLQGGRTISILANLRNGGKLDLQGHSDAQVGGGYLIDKVVMQRTLSSQSGKCTGSSNTT